MGIEDRFTWLIIGCVIGFFAGYVTKSLREVHQDLSEVHHDLNNIKEELDEVDEIVKEDHQRLKDRERNEDGLMRNYHPVLANVALAVVIILTVWASFASQKASNDVQKAQDRIDQVTHCNLMFLNDTLTALNERTTYTQEQAQANVDLQTAQAQLFSILRHQPPYDQVRQDKAVEDYVKALNDFVQLSGKSKEKANQNPFPTEDELTRCVTGENGP